MKVKGNSVRSVNNTNDFMLDKKRKAVEMHVPDALNIGDDKRRNDSLGKDRSTIGVGKISRTFERLDGPSKVMSGGTRSILKREC